MRRARGVATAVARSGVVHAGVAFLAMGAWAAFANRDHGPAAMAIAGVAQGGVSAILTAILKRSLEAMTARMRGWGSRVLPPLVTMAAVLAVLLSVHHLARTPAAWATIAVPYTVSSAYAWIYVAVLRLADRRRADGV